MLSRHAEKQCWFRFGFAPSRDGGWTKKILDGTFPLVGPGVTGQGQVYDAESEARDLYLVFDPKKQVIVTVLRAVQYRKRMGL